MLEDIPTALLLPPGELQRQDEPLVPVRVVREALVNALMRQNFRLNSPLQILRYANRLEIRNPGHSLVALDRLGDPGSRLRNPAVAGVLHETRFAENKGSGIRIMREQMRAAGLSPPAFDSDREKDEFVATLLFHHFLGPEDVAWLSQFQEHGLADDEARILVFAREKGSITNAECRNLTGLDTLAGAVTSVRDDFFAAAPDAIHNAAAAGENPGVEERVTSAGRQRRFSRIERDDVCGQTRCQCAACTQGYTTAFQRGIE